jgi:HEAT repeat protein
VDDEDPQVVAAAAAQLRRRSIPGVLPRLIEMLDSPHAPIRKAARKGLGEFSFKRFLNTFDMLDDEVRESTAALVKKVDPQTLPLLYAELASNARSRKLRALSIAMVMGVVPQLEDLITGLLQDEDHIVRADAATALAKGDSRGSLAALCAAIHDRAATVRDAAMKSLEERGHASPSPPMTGAADVQPR